MLLGSRIGSARRAVVFFLVAFFVGFIPLAPARAADHPTTDESKKRIDALMAETFKPDGPGAAVIAVKDGKVIYRKAYGMANLELGVAMKPEMVFEIGSVTKQFTAVATLMLVEQGKVALDADIRTYLPDFPDKGERITVENLLTHTSGIKNYTDIPAWREKIREDVSLQELIAFFKDEPLDFKPGTKWSYSNSGFVLLGAIVEKASGIAYAKFMQANIFEPLSMKHTGYGDATRLIPNRATGYHQTPDGFVNADYHSMTHPHAAGALVSSVDDLAIWDAAVSSGKLLKKESWARAFTDYKLADGSLAGYGYGWQIEAVKGRRIIHHGGGIPGFITEVLRMPDDGIYVAMLTNCEPPVADLTRLAELIALDAAGAPYVEPKPVAVDPAVLDAYVGVYRIDDKVVRTVKREGDHLVTQRTGGSVLHAYPSSATEFFYKESFTTFVFERENGNVARMVMTTQDGKREAAARTNEPLPAERATVTVAPEILDSYVGDYELSLTTKVTISREGAQMFAQLTGQPKLEIFAESNEKFFLKVVDAQIVFEKGEDGKVNRLVIHQGGNSVPATRKSH